MYRFLAVKFVFLFDSNKTQDCFSPRVTAPSQSQKSLHTLFLRGGGCLLLSLRLCNLSSSIDTFSAYLTVLLPQDNAR